MNRRLILLDIKILLVFKVINKVGYVNILVSIILNYLYK